MSEEQSTSENTRTFRDARDFLIAHREDYADVSIELIDRAVRFDARMGLRYPAHIAEVGVAAVAEAGVDPGEVDGHRTAQSTGLRASARASRLRPLAP